jgi:hypothetical protein
MPALLLEELNYQALTSPSIMSKLRREASGEIVFGVSLTA